MQRIAVIGGGAAGASVVAEFIRSASNLELFWLIGDHRPGRGVAYASDNARHLLNVRAANMGLFADDPGGLVRYLHEHNLPGSGSDFLPRQLFGDYIEATLAKLIRECPAGVRVHMVYSEAVSLVPLGSSYAIATQDGGTLYVDGAVLAVGSLPPVPIAQVTHDAIEGGRYLPDPWKPRQFDHVPQRVVVLGSGLTAVDVILSAASRWPEARIVALSRHGCLPAAHRGGPAQEYHGAPELVAHLRDGHEIRRWFRLVREAAEQAGPNWRPVLDSLRPFTTELWRTLDDAQRCRFLRHVRWAWETLRHRLPPQTDEALEDLQEEGRLSVVAGRIRSIGGNQPLILTYRRRDNGSVQTLLADLAIQATGLHTAVERTAHPLLRQMLRNGLVRADAQGLGIVANIDGGVVRADGSNAPGLRVIGPLLRGVLLECTALPEIRMLAARIARELPADLRGHGEPASAVDAAMSR